MATMPTIDYGSRRLEIPSNVIIPMTNAGASRYRMEIGRDIQNSLDTASRAFFQIERIKDQADRRDAEYAMRQAQIWFDSQWYGRDEVDQQTGEKKHIPGVADRDYRAFEMDKTDSMRECARLKKEFRETDIYKNLSGGTKSHFDRQFAIYESRLDIAAAENHRKITAQKINVQNADKVSFVSANVQRDFGSSDAAFENSVNWGATQITAMRLGSLVENSDEIAANGNLRVKDIVFRGGKRFDQLTDEEKKYVKDIFDKSAKDFRVSRIKALADAASTGNGLGTMTPEQCLDKAMEMTFVLNGAANGFDPKTGAKNPGNDGNPGNVIVDDVERNGLLGYINNAGVGLDRARKIQQSNTAMTLNKEFSDEILKGTEDTNGLLEKKFDKVAYAQKISSLVATRQLDERNAALLVGQYNQLADRQRIVQDAISRHKATGTGGVWTRVKDRNGKEINVFQQDRLGNGKTETDPTIAAKYTLVGRDGVVPFFNNPTAGMDELDYDFQMGNISAPFYTAQMAKMRVYSDEKAKAAFVKIFGAEPTIFSEKDIDSFSKQGIEITHKEVWAKNKYWAGNHNIDKRSVTWQEDALNEDGGEYKISLEQETQLCEIVLSMTAKGADPTETIHQLLAPKIQGWVNSDLADRLSDVRKNGKTFLEAFLDANTKMVNQSFDDAKNPKSRFVNGSPAEREARLQERKKQAYEAK